MDRLHIATILVAALIGLMTAPPSRLVAQGSVGKAAEAQSGSLSGPQSDSGLPDVPAPPQPATDDAAANGAKGEGGPSLSQFLESQIMLLGSPQFRERELAYWRLRQYPRQALPLIRRHLPNSSVETGGRLIDLLTEIALSNDIVASDQASQILNQTADELTSLGQLARNTVATMADIQEERATELLGLHGARIGPRDFGLNGQFSAIAEWSLSIDDQFTGDLSVVRRIKYLKSVETVSLSGPKINRAYYEAVAQLKNLRNLKLKHVRLTPDDLALFRELTHLEHLGINYVDIDDRVLDVLVELPMSQSLRLYGTKISEAGAQRLHQQLDGLEITCLRGGFLGVGTELLSNTVVARVTPGSAAEAAGIEPGDILRKVGGNPIHNFMELRVELGKYVPGDAVEIELERDGATLQVSATLTEEPDMSR